MLIPQDWDRPKRALGRGSSYYPPLQFPKFAEDSAPNLASAFGQNGGGVFVGGSAASTSAPSPFARLEGSGTVASAPRTLPTWPEGAGRLPASPLRERPLQDRQDQHFVTRPALDDSPADPSMGSRGRPTCGDAPVQASQAGGKLVDQDVEVRCPHLPEAPGPWRTWQECALPQKLLSQLVGAGFAGPSPIQQYSWSIAHKGHDMIGIAKTGSGKTLAFLMPAFGRLIDNNADPRAPPAILVLSPTRELACQIEQEAKKFGGPAGMRTACLYGGASKGPQLAELRQRPQVIVATPGRLNDLLDPPPGMTLGVDLKSVQFLVLDEADRMLDMGFEPQIRKIIANVPKERQTMMFTATWPPAIRRMAQDFMKEAVEVRVGEVEQLQVNPDIEQHVVFVNDQIDRQNRLDEVLREAGEGQAIVFVSTKRMCDSISFRVPNSVAIHGDKDQGQRDAALAAFKSGSKRVLVATDVAARGLDVKSVVLVVNFDPPSNNEDYIHRVGRTGRAGNKGKAVTLLSNEDGSAAKFIAEVLRGMSLPVPAELERRLSSGEMRSGGGGGRARSQSRGPMRRGGGAFGHDDDDDFGRDSGRFSRGFGGRDDSRGFGGMNDCPTGF